MEKSVEEQITIAMRHYQNQRNAAKAYAERNRQAKKDAGTYRPRGRPRKNPSDKTDIAAI